MSTTYSEHVSLYVDGEKETDIHTYGQTHGRGPFDLDVVGFVKDALPEFVRQFSKLFLSNDM